MASLLKKKLRKGRVYPYSSSVREGFRRKEAREGGRILEQDGRSNLCRSRRYHGVADSYNGWNKVLGENITSSCPGQSQCRIHIFFKLELKKAHTYGSPTEDMNSNNLQACRHEHSSVAIEIGRRGT